jgi:hypothetical protein
MREVLKAWIPIVAATLEEGCLYNSRLDGKDHKIARMMMDEGILRVWSTDGTIEEFIGVPMVARFLKEVDTKAVSVPRKSGVR